MRSLYNAKLDWYPNASDKAVVGHNTKAKDEFQPKKMDSARSISSSMDISDDKKANPKT